MRIRPYYTYDLGCLYFPNSIPHSATRQLKRWINYNKELRRELDKTGYLDKQRVLTPTQVELICHYLGEP